MIADRVEGKWIDPFAEVFARCKVGAGDACAVVSETQFHQRQGGCVSGDARMANGTR